MVLSARWVAILLLPMLAVLAIPGMETVPSEISDEASFEPDALIKQELGYAREHQAHSRDGGR